MKTGMNLESCWTTEVTPEHDGLLEQLKGDKFDPVEVPVFAVNDGAPLRAAWKASEGAWAQAQRRGR